MRKRFSSPRTAVLAVAAALAAAAGSAAAAPPKDLDAYVAKAMQTFEAPGMSVAVVEDGKAVWAKGYGVRKLGEPAPADAHTVFPIGSNTKAFTATALAMLVDEGKLSWDDKVEARLPGFQMSDPYATGEMTVVDMLTHRSGLGLGQGDLMVFPETDFTRREIVDHLRYLKTPRTLRSGYAYDNVLYIAAGQMVENVSGRRWEDFMHTRVFAPLGMNDAKASFGEIKPGSNAAWPHARLDGPLRGLGHIQALGRVENIDAAAPAGAINASAEDMTKWLEVQLDRGALPDGKGRLFSEAQSAMLFTPQTIIPTGPVPGPLSAASSSFKDYALGFIIQDYRGHKVILHGGAVTGGISMVVLIPEKHVGFAVMTNSEEGGALRSVYFHLLDHYLGETPIDWIDASVKARETQTAQALAAIKASPAGAPDPSKPPSLPLSGYAGTYSDPWYGTITIRQDGAGLNINFDRTHDMKGPLEPVRYNTFRTRFTDRTIEDAYVTFSLDAEGKVDHVSMKPISPLADFSFDFQDLSFTPVKGK
ncbi:MAG: serine hydrolase [Proteobacteria bacterium]|nr:serine hydrolase [Pseudomonadota bacterium]